MSLFGFQQEMNTLFERENITFFDGATPGNWSLGTDSEKAVLTIAIRDSKTAEYYRHKVHQLIATYLPELEIEVFIEQVELASET